VYSDKLLERISEIMSEIMPIWNTERHSKKACYLSAEFLIGRVTGNNFFNLHKLAELSEFSTELEDIEDAALGNGGLGRLAACFLDSAASLGYRLDGFGIRYKYGLFKQSIDDGYQKEYPDDWAKFGDPWSIRRDNEKELIRFSGQSVWAVPYDMPIIGYGGKTINTLRLWQAEPVESFNLDAYDAMDFDSAFRSRNEAEAISAVLYPNDNSPAGKILRLKQEYFFSAASIRSILRNYNGNLRDLSKSIAIQLNDTHPVVAIPELLRILTAEQGIDFNEALEITRSVFSYTNHTVMSEAMESWDAELFASVLPELYAYIVQLQNKLRSELFMRLPSFIGYDIISGGRIHMARLAVFASHAVNGVSELHTEILKNNVLQQWYALYPNKFSNKTNGITQRKWLGQCNPDLSSWISERIGESWITKLTELKRLETLANDKLAINEFAEIKQYNKLKLAEYLSRQDYGLKINPDSLFYVQVKRIHEYKRQLLNAFSILDIYFRLRAGELPDFYPSTFIFGGKAASSYRRAKGIIKFINEVANLINSSPVVRDKMTVIFIPNYNVSCAEIIIPAADISEQISTAGTEASGTGNMKFMLNGAITLGTYDGANIEIVNAAGEENNFIFGARVEEIAEINYIPAEIYRNNSNIRRVLDTLIDGTFSDGGTGIFQEIFDSIVYGSKNEPTDKYYLLLDFDSYVDTKLKANYLYKNEREHFYEMQLINTANAGQFSSDRTIEQYAKEIWKL